MKAECPLGGLIKSGTILLHVRAFWSFTKCLYICGGAVWAVHLFCISHLLVRENFVKVGEREEESGSLI